MQFVMTSPLAIDSDAIFSVHQNANLDGFFVEQDLFPIDMKKIILYQIKDCYVHIIKTLILLTLIQKKQTSCSSI
jgi:hypothetical protein